MVHEVLLLRSSRFVWAPHALLSISLVFCVPAVCASSLALVGLYRCSADRSLVRHGSLYTGTFPVGCSIRSRRAVCSQSHAMAGQLGRQYTQREPHLEASFAAIQTRPLHVEAQVRRLRWYQTLAAFPSESTQAFASLLVQAKMRDHTHGASRRLPSTLCKHKNPHMLE